MHFTVFFVFFRVFCFGVSGLGRWAQQGARAGDEREGPTNQGPTNQAQCQFPSEEPT